MEDKQHIEKLIDNNISDIHRLIQEKVDIWKEHVVFTDLWWIGVGLSILPWILWFIFRKKKSTDRILYAGFFVIIIALALDIVGDQFGLWHYRFNVLPIVPTYFPWDVTLMPVTVIFFLQIKPNSNPFLKAVLFALFSAFIAEPFFQWMGVYVPTKWKFHYSIPIQILIYLVAHYLSRRDKFSPFYKKVRDED
ncbi:CBO0543 family protein [Niallia sp. 03133]|uniref:CBO0543 family protein n=1 Tax=Niallia sp. 03133 TaxID=3458060 RepID=UPI004044EDC8